MRLRPRGTPRSTEDMKFIRIPDGYDAVAIIVPDQDPTIVMHLKDWIELRDKVEAKIMKRLPPTDTDVGSDERVAVYTERVSKQWPTLFHPEDRDETGPSTKLQRGPIVDKDKLRLHLNNYKKLYLRKVFSRHAIHRNADEHYDDIVRTRVSRGLERFRRTGEVPSACYLG